MNETTVYSVSLIALSWRRQQACLFALIKVIWNLDGVRFFINYIIDDVCNIQMITCRSDTYIFHWWIFRVICYQVRVLSCLWRTWWRHQMETISASLALCAGNSPVPVSSPHIGQWRGALVFSLICAWINDWVNKRGVVIWDAIMVIMTSL